MNIAHVNHNYNYFTLYFLFLLQERAMAHLPSTMKAAQVIAHSCPLEIGQVPVPTPGTGELLVKLQVTGICHTDVHVQMGDWKV